MADLLTGGPGDAPLLDAATVVLVRDGATGLECLMLRKTSGQAFGGLWVFPGGRVEEDDGPGYDGARAVARAAAMSAALSIPCSVTHVGGSRSISRARWRASAAAGLVHT